MVDGYDDSFGEPLKSKEEEDEFDEGVGASQSETSEKGENNGELAQNEQKKEVEPDQVDPNESKTEVSSEQFDPNESNDEVSSEQFDPNESESSEEKEVFNPNSPDEEIQPEQFDPNEDGEENEENEFDPNDDDDMETKFDPNDYGEEVESELNPPDTEKSEEEKEEGHQENISSQSTSTVLVSENREEIQDLDHDQDELEREVEKELEEGVEAINQYLEEEAEFINAYQEIVGEARELDKELAGEGEEPLKTEEEWEKEVETAAYAAEQLYESMNEIEVNTNNEEIYEVNEELEIEKEAEQSAEVLEPQLSDLQEEFEEGMKEVEQHQVVPFIEEALETEPESIVNEKGIEQLQELDLEEQFNEVHEKESMEELIEWHDEQIEQEKEEEVEAQTDNSEEIVSELEEEFEEGMNEVEQHQVEAAIEEELEMEPESIVNEKELEKFQEMELEEQFQAIELNEFIEELVEKQEEDKTEQEKENLEQAQEIIHQPTYHQEKLEEQEQELEMEYEEKEEVERHQVEAAIEEELETEPKPIIREEELEYVKNFEPDKQLEAELFYELIEKLKYKENEEKEEHKELSTEEKVALIKRELGISQEIKSGDIEVENRQVEVLEHETISPDVSEQSKKNEQEVFNEINSGEEDSDKTVKQNYEKLKKLYRQQTGKRPIYANLETKGFKQWLEQKKESEEKEKAKQELDLKEEQKSEETWKRTLKNRIEEAREIKPGLKSKLIKLVEKYNELEKLIKKYSQLHNKAQRKELSQAERNELNSLVEELLKLDPIKIELFLALQEIKRYIEQDDYYYYEYWNNQHHHKVFSHFFTQLSQRYNSIKKIQKAKIIEELLENWIEQTFEAEINLELIAVLSKIVINYNELEELTTNFMKLYEKVKIEKLIKSEQIEFKSLIKTLQKFDPLIIELFTNVRAIKHYLNDQNHDELLNKTRVNRMLNKYLKYISRKYENRKHEIQKLKELINPYEKLILSISSSEFDGSVYDNDTINSKKENILMSHTSELFVKFMQYTHETELIKNLVNEFNKSGLWIKNLRPTQTLVNFINKKRKLLENNPQKNSSSTIKKQVEIISTYISLINKIKENDILTKAIRNLILKNKQTFNAYDIEQWLLITNNSARNQLKKMFTEEEYQKYVRTQKYASIDIIEEIVKIKGGKCHTKEIKNARTKLHLECSESHHFFPTYYSVVNHNTWCPECHIYVSETICRQFFERIFNKPFPKRYPPWLVNRNGNQMELDGYNKELGVAFEYQGIQHRKKAFGRSEDEVKKIQEEDAYKLQKCKENGVILIQIPDDEIVAYEEMQNYIIQNYEKKSGKTLGIVPKYNYREFTIYENEHAKKFRVYIEEKGGTLLTPYLTAKKEVTILCEQGHKWTTTPDSIYKNNWCSECAGNKKGTTEEYQKIGEKFQCELLNEYVNAKTPLQYKCQEGHIFTRIPYWLNRTYKETKNICPKCERELFAENFQIAVRNKGGQILTPYKGRFKPIKIKCKKEHEWETTPGATYQGRWCKICANENNPNKMRKESAEQEFLKKIKSINYSLLSKYENNTKQVQIKCQNKHKFTMTPKYFKRLVNQKIEPCLKCRKNN